MKFFTRVLGVCVVLVAVSCESNLELDGGLNKRVGLSFDSCFENPSDTKTEFSQKDTTQILWSAGEKISLFWSGYSHACFTSDNKEPALRARFSGVINVISGLYEQTATETSQFLALYPYSDSNKCEDGKHIEFDVDSLQYAVAGNLPVNAFPAMARSENMNLTFYNVCGGLAFSLVNNNIKSIEVQANAVGDKRPAIAGRIKAGFDDNGKPFITEVLDTARIITIRPSKGETFESGKTYYLTLLPGVLENGFTMTFYTQTMKGTKEVVKNIEVKRSVFGKMTDIDKDLDFKVCVESIKITSDIFELDLGSEYQFGVEVIPDYATDKRMIWLSDNEEIATVDSTGLIVPQGEGRCIITVQSIDNKLACDTCEVCCVKVNHLSRIDGEPAWANCYIVNSPGIYDIETVRGISGTSIGMPDTACVLWEFISSDEIAKKGCLIKSVKLQKGKLRIYTPDVLKNGSASVAVKDNKGTVLWSWHIWLNEGFNPSTTGQTYKNGVHVMDRHLGALTSKSSCPPALMYQWGRKDPFIPNNKPSSFSTGEWPDKVASTANTGTIEYAVSNPMTFIKGGANGSDWYFATDAQKKTRWQDSSKTDYDPCPYGWRVPTGGSKGFWASAATTGATYTWSYKGEGADLQNVFALSAPEWYQCTGYLNTEGILTASNSVVFLWTSTFADRAAYSMTVNYALTKINANASDYGSEGCGVRCVKE